MNLRRVSSFASVSLISLVFLVALSISANAQGAQDTGTDLQFHKFQPKVAPDRAVTASSAPSGIQGIGATAAQQMLSLQQDKAARTPPQKKIDSNLIYTMRMLAGKPVADGVPFLDTGVDLDSNDNFVVDIVANVSDQLLQQLAAAGGQILYQNAGLRSIRAIIPPNQIEGIASSPDVIFISPKQAQQPHAFNRRFQEVHCYATPLLQVSTKGRQACAGSSPCCCFPPGERPSPGRAVSARKVISRIVLLPLVAPSA